MHGKRIPCASLYDCLVLVICGTLELLSTMSEYDFQGKAFACYALCILLVHRIHHSSRGTHILGFSIKQLSSENEAALTLTATSHQNVVGKKGT